MNKEKAEIFCAKYRLSEKLIELLVLIPQTYWWVFTDLVEKKPTQVTVKAGWYSYLGPTPKKESILNDMVLACTRAKMKFKVFNVAPKGGAHGQRVTIFIPNDETQQTLCL